MNVYIIMRRHRRVEDNVLTGHGRALKGYNIINNNNNKSRERLDDDDDDDGENDGDTLCSNYPCVYILLIRRPR